MSCISSNFSSFFLNSLNDPSEFAKYLSNGELKFSSFEDIQVFGSSSTQQQYSTQHPQHAFNGVTGSNIGAHNATVGIVNNNSESMFTSASNSSMHMEHSGLQQQQQQQHQTQHATHFGQHVAQSAAAPHTHAQAQTPIANTLYHHAQQQQSHNNHTQHPPQHNSTTVTTTPANVANSNNNNNTHAAQRWPTSHANNAQHFDGSFEFLKYLRHSNDFNAGAATAGGAGANGGVSGNVGGVNVVAAAGVAGAVVSGIPTSNTGEHVNDNQHQHLNGQTATTTSASTVATAAAASSSSSCSTSSTSHANAIATSNAIATAASLIDLDSTSQKSRSRKVAALLSSVSRASNSLDSNNTLDVFDHDSKHTIFDLHPHMTNSSNSNESSLELSSLAFPNSHLNASNSNTSSEGAAAGTTEFSILNTSASNAPKPLATFVIKENFDVHPSHKVEEGIFQHMNKLPPKKKENLKQLGVRFTGQMTLADKSIVVENFIKFCQEYDIKDHRPFLSLNQSGLNKPEQIKFARYLGQGLPTFTLFCIYSNFKNLFCTKRTEIYTKDGYNLPYILDKTKRFLSNTTADLKNMLQQQSNDSMDYTVNNNNNTHLGNAELTTTKCMIMPRVLENLVIYENFDVHETHRIEDGICTHLTRLPTKKQEIFKQFGIQNNNQNVSYYEKYIIIENFIKFCNEYQISDHRPFLDFNESGLPKCEQLKFVRYLGQGLPNLTLNKIFLAFKDVLGLNRIEKITVDGYNLDTILKKKKKNLYNRMNAAGIATYVF